MTSGGRILMVIVVLAFVGTGFYYLLIADGDGGLNPSKSLVLEPVAPVAPVESVRNAPAEPVVAAPEPEPIAPLPLATNTVTLQIAATASGLSSLDLPELRRRFQADGPGTARAGDYGWHAVYDPAIFADSPELLGALTRDPASYFQDRFGLVVEPVEGTLWIMLHRGDRSIVPAVGRDLDVMAIHETSDALDRDAVEIVFDEATRKRVSGFVADNLSRPCAFVVDGDVVAVRPLARSMADALVVSGSFSPDQVASIRSAISGQGTLVAMDLPLPPAVASETSNDSMVLMASGTIATTSNPDPDPVASTPVGAGTRYTVKSGDSLSSIAQDWFGTSSSWTLIATANPSLDPDRLVIGQVLILPDKNTKPAPIKARSGTHVVRSGETLSSIAKSYYGDERLWSAIYEANRSTIGADAGTLKVGMTLVMPDASKPSS
jgi:nucleoid-associated protein YgaU